MSGFVHLHCHTVWSLLDGAIQAEALPQIAAELGYEAVAMTDHDALTGAVRFSRACRDAGVKPIFGAELTLERGEHVTLIAKNSTGYANLCRLISNAHLGHERGKPESTFDKVVERAEGLFVFSGCERGEVAKLATAGRMPDAIAAARKWRNAIGEDYRVEVFDHRGYGHRTLRDRLLGIATETGIRAVATNDVHYPSPFEASTHELLHAIKNIVPLSKTQAFRPNSEYGFKAPFAMRELFHDAPEVCDETLRIAEACDFDLDLGNYHFPELHGLKGGARETEVKLTKLCYEGADRRFGKITQEVDDRLQHELRLIAKMGFSAFFLLVADIVDHIRNVMGIRCACRGSAAGSLVCYVLNISDVDPIRYDLLFERFMNERREEIPDIDMDVESHRREEILTYILETYGADQTAICCMVDTFRARGAIREVGKAMGMPPEEIDVVAKAFPRVRAKDIPAAIERLPELAGTNLRAGQLEKLFELCMAIDGFPRHLALHPCGVIISSPDLPDRVPMQESFQGFTMLQADKDDVEELGLPKLDVLGVRMLSSITHAVKEIERIEDTKVDLASLPHDDKETYELIKTSKTLGCFQIESPGQRELIARYQPNRFEDLIVDISLFRPGPVKSDMVSPFLERFHGFQDVAYAHASLEPILKETEGVVVFHEQVIRVIAAVTGCSLADADYVRRHLDAERPSLPDDPGHKPDRFKKPWMDKPEVQMGTDVESGVPRPAKKKSSSHPGMGRGFRELPEAIAWGADFLSGSSGSSGSQVAECAELSRGIGVVLEKQELGSEWVKDKRVHNEGVSGPIVISPPDDDVGTWFIGCAIDNGFTPDQARHLWKEVFSFASFGFCKSHAAAFALPTYISAWLKAHHPSAFLAGVLTHDPGMYPRRLIVADARNFGIPILPIDVNASFADYRVEPTEEGGESRERGPFVERSRRTPAGRSRKAPATVAPTTVNASNLGIRLALSEVRGISEAEVGSIVSARADGPFTSLEDLWRRTDISAPVVENLIHVGALETTDGRGRRELIWKAREVWAEPRPKVGEQLALTLQEPIQEELSELPPYTALEEVEAELEVSGIDARHHIMELYKPLMTSIGCVPANELAEIKNNSLVWVGGVKVASQTPAIRSGQRIIFVTIDDITGPIDVTVFERVQARCARTVFHSWLLLFRGLVRKRGGASRRYETDSHNVGVTVVVQEAFDLAEIARDRAAGHSFAMALGRQRRKQSYRVLDTKATDAAPTRLWHASGGSAGR
ncbi:MAG: error-prone polymerase [Actinomycetota bacterium]|nr:error-prone polymerase [Actinomycetota bacterium]